MAVNVQTIPDYCQLGNRLHIVDGVNHNLVMDGLHSGERPMGARAQTGAISPALSAGEALEPNSAYVYGVRRVIVSGDLEIPSSAKTGTVTTGLYVMTCGAAGADGDSLADWQAIADAEFGIRVDGEDFTVREVDFTAAHSDGLAETMDEVVRRIEAAVQAEVGTPVQAAWDTDHFEFSSDRGRVEHLFSVSGTGTDVSGSAYMNGQSGTASETYDLQCEVTLEDYEEAPDESAGDWWTVKYQVLRGLANSADTLYLVAELTQAEFDALSSGVYTDSTADDDLDASVSLDLSAVRNVRFPPVRCIRSLSGCLVGAGSFSYTAGTVTGAADSDQLTVNSPGAVSMADFGAYVWIDEEPVVYQVSAVDEDAGVLTLSENLSADADEAAWAKWHDFETVYVSPPLPGNIEGWIAGTEIVGNSGDGRRIRALAAKNGTGYVFSDNRVELLQRVSGQWTLRAHPSTPPGCVGHATVADQWGDAVYYYAGDRGVWRITPSAAQNISAKIATVFRDRVDHSQDEFCHAVYNPQRQWYMLWVFETDWEDIGFRCPQLCLVYDAPREQWYRFELAAESSGVLLTSDYRPVVSIGLGEAVFTLDSDSVDGADLATYVSAAGENWLEVDGDISGVQVGQPVHVRDADGALQRRIVSAATDSRVYIYGTWDTVPAAEDSARFGAVRWEWNSRTLASDGQSAGGVREMQALSTVAVLHDVESADTPATITVQALGKQSDRSLSVSRDWSDEDDLDEIRGADAGLRARRSQVTIAGERGPATIHELQTDWQAVAKGRGK